MLSTYYMLGNIGHNCMLPVIEINIETNDHSLIFQYISIYAYYLHDALLTWANAVTALRAANRSDWNKGDVVASYIRNMSGIPSMPSQHASFS